MSGRRYVTVCCLLQGYYRRGDANFALGKFKEALKDFRTVSNWAPWEQPGQAVAATTSSSSSSRCCFLQGQGHAAVGSKVQCASCAAAAAAAVSRQRHCLKRSSQNTGVHLPTLRVSVFTPCLALGCRPQAAKVAPNDPDLRKKLSECEKAVKRIKFEEALATPVSWQRV